MSATEDHTVAQPDETKPVEPVAATAADTTTEEPAAAEVAPEMAILTKDPVVVASDLEKAEPVSGEPSTSAAPAATTEETPAEPTPPTPEKHKEGSTLLGFLKKFPNPKSVDKKSTGKSTSDTPATSEIEPVPATTSAPVVAEPAEEKPFESDYVEFKTHGGFFRYVLLLFHINV